MPCCCVYIWIDDNQRCLFLECFVPNRKTARLKRLIKIDLRYVLLTNNDVSLNLIFFFLDFENWLSIRRLSSWIFNYRSIEKPPKYFRNPERYPLDGVIRGSI